MKIEDFTLVIPCCLGEYLLARGMTSDIAGDKIIANAYYDLWKHKLTGAFLAVKIEQ